MGAAANEAGVAASVSGRGSVPSVVPSESQQANVSSGRGVFRFARASFLSDCVCTVGYPVAAAQSQNTRFDRGDSPPGPLPVLARAVTKYALNLVMEHGTGRVDEYPQHVSAEKQELLEVSEPSSSNVVSGAPPFTLRFILVT
jgi:hypothetical protein